jgi:hypothetical protein
MFRMKNRSIIVSYMTLRKLIGILGVLLPFICILGGFLFAGLPVQESISAYYHTNMRDFFVGLISGVSLFLITYQGHEIIDNIVTSLSGLAGLGIAVFPCLYSTTSTRPLGIFQLEPATSNTVHLICASAFFILLALNSLFLFTLTKSKKIPKTKNKRTRNFIYRVCGLSMLISLISLFFILFLADQEQVTQNSIILIFETIMLFAFGISWLVKGETLFKDRQKKLP